MTADATSTAPRARTPATGPGRTRPIGIDPTAETILDAARDAILHFGIRRMTLTDVARRAGVSRMTLYRRYPSVDAVLRDLMTREFAGLISDDAAGRGVRDVREAIVSRLAVGAAALRSHPLFRKVVEAEPELLMPYVLGQMGSTQNAAAALLRAEIERGQVEGSVRPGDPALLAQTVLLVAQSWVLSAHLAPDVAEEALLGELPRILHGALAP